jgi:hypothetical protein
LLFTSILFSKYFTWYTSFFNITHSYLLHFPVFVTLSHYSYSKWYTCMFLQRYNFIILQYYTFLFVTLSRFCYAFTFSSSTVHISIVFSSTVHISIVSSSTVHISIRIFFNGTHFHSYLQRYTFVFHVASLRVSRCFALRFANFMSLPYRNY